MMTKKERIAALEARVSELAAKVAMLEARPLWTWTNPAVWSPFYVGDGTAAGLPSTNPTISWANGTAVKQ
jgi:hypothetical protein